MRFKNTYFLSVLTLFFILISCAAKTGTAITVSSQIDPSQTQAREIAVGANNTASYLPLLAGKNVALVTNQTSVIFKKKRLYAFGGFPAFE